MAPSTETSTSETSQPGQPSPTTFPRFGDLPVEIRHMIWQLALENSLEPRIIPLHIHIRTIKQQGNDGEGNPQDSNTSSQIKVRYIAESTQTSACKYCYQVSHHPGVTLPSLLTVCRESRAITRRNYGIYFSKLCDATTGRPLDPQPQERPEEPLRVPPPPPLPWQVNNGALFPWIQASLNNIMSHNEGLTKTIRKGVYANPAIDHFGLQVQIATQGRLEVIDGFIAVAEHEKAFATRIQTFLIELSTGGRPYLWYRQNQFDRWRRIGEDPSWVPAKKLIKFERLKEIIVFVRGRIMLTVFPEEWRVRSEQQWREELMKVREEWPAKWKGEMPKLTFKLRDENMLRPEYETLIYV